MKYLLLLIITPTLLNAIALNDVFTYQGHLSENNQPVNGTQFFIVEFYDAETGGNIVASVPSTPTEVIDGIFTLQIDIGDMPFNGEEVWLQLYILPNNIGPILENRGALIPEPLLPRQLITNAPYAIQSKFVATDGVSTSSIKNSAVNGDKIANDSINSSHYVDGSVQGIHIGNNEIGSDNIQTRAILSRHISMDAIGSANIEDGSIINNDIRQGTITSVQLANNSVGSFELMSDSIDGSKISNGSITADDINSNSIQRRITGNCVAGSSIRAISSDGSVTCETIQSPQTAWQLNGNSGTNSSTDFIGTTDDQPFLIKANNQQAFFAEHVANNTGGTGFINSIIGNSNVFLEFAGSRLESSTILGGDANQIGTRTASATALRSAILGGNSNDIRDSDGASIIAGTQNDISSSNYSTILGGQLNKINAPFSFAAGFASVVNHRGSWVWNDASDVLNTSNSLSTTANNQFLIRATGGFGIGTNAPASPFHIKGQGTSTGSTNNSNEVVMTIEPNNNSSDVAAVINKLDASRESAMIFSINSQPEFDIRTANGGAMDINSYDNAGNATVALRINGSNRIDINSNLEPFTNNVYNFGAPSFRWANIYASNPVDVSSDMRLKNNIETLDYGLSEVLSLKPVIYNWKNGDSKKHIGLIAQEVEKVIPEVVSATHDEKAMRSMRYTELIPLLIKATQEQQVLIEQQNQHIKDLQETLSQLQGITKITAMDES